MSPAEIALRELVALHDLKDDIERWVRDDSTGQQWPQMQPYERRMAAVDDYNRRKPIAWEAARDALRAAAAVPQAPAPAPAEPYKNLLLAALMSLNDLRTAAIARGLTDTDARLIVACAVMERIEAELLQPDDDAPAQAAPLVGPDVATAIRMMVSHYGNDPRTECVRQWLAEAQGAAK